MKKLKTALLTCLVACIAVAACFAMVACGDKTPEYAIEWKLDEHVTVVADGYSELPTKVKEGTDVVFTVTPDNGWEIQSVSSPAKKSGDKYTFKVSKDTTITVKVKEGVEGITATLKEDKVYYAGETIDAADVNVSVKYKTDRTETVTSGYSIGYASGEALSIGDKDITVTYGGVAGKLTLPTLENEEGVVALVTIDTDGGELTQAYRDTISANADLGHVNYADGILSFTHKGLSAAVALPSIENAEVTKGGDGDYILRGWNGSETTTSIPRNTVVSVTYKLTNSPVLFNLKKVYYEVGGTADEQIPYLVIEGEFKLAESAYLYLYEGNADVELKGDTVAKDADDRSFKLLFDMRKLVDSETDFEGKWMDIKFVAGEGDDALTQEIILEDYADIEDFCNTDQIITVGGYDYKFAVYTAEGTTTPRYLKALYESGFVTDYAFEAGTATEGEGDDAVTLPALVINGQIIASQVETYKGKTVSIDAWADKNVGPWTATIGETGAWTMTIPLTTDVFAYGVTGYMHFSILDGTNEIYKFGDDGNFLNKGCTGGLSAIEDRTGLSETLTGNAIRIANDDESQVFYIGEGQWGGIIASARNERADIMRLTTTGAKLEAGQLEDGTDAAFLVFTGTWAYGVEHTFDETADLETLKSLFTQYGVQISDPGNSGFNWWNWLNGASDANTKAANTVFVIHENGTFEVKIALNGATVGSHWYAHYEYEGRGTADVAMTDQTVDETPVTVGGLKFSFYDSSVENPFGIDWLQGRVIIYVEAADAE